MASDVRGIFALLRAGDLALANSFASSVGTAYPKDPKAFEENIDVLFTLDFTTSASIFSTMGSGGSGKALAPFTDRFLTLVESGKVQHGMDTLVVSVLTACASDAPEVVLPHLDRIYKAFIKVPNADTSLAMLVGACGKAPGASARVTAVLGGMLFEAALAPHTLPVVLGCLVNQTQGLGENYAAMDPFMDKVTPSFAAHACMSLFALRK
jgi:hypothetical protein